MQRPTESSRVSDFLRSAPNGLPGQVVLVLQLRTAAGLAGPLVDYPFDTTRTAVQLVLNGIIDRYPEARIILSHAGGFVPYASHRFAELAHVFRTDAADPADVLKSFQRFYFDTALSSGPSALPSLMAFAQEDRILFGTDYPFAPADVAASFTGKLDAYDGLTADERSAISNRNAGILFPRLTPKDAAPERRSART